MSFGLGGEAVHEDGTEQGARAGDQWQYPGPGGVGGAGDIALALGRRHAVAGEDLQEEVGAEPQRLVEDDSAETRDRSDGDAENDPALEVGRSADPLAN